MQLRRPLVSLVAACLVACVVGGCSGTDGAGNEGTKPGGAPELKPATVEFVTFSSIERLTPLVDVDSPTAGSAIDLAAARGEREGAQLVAWATSGEPRVVLETGDLRAKGGSRIDAAHVRAYVEHAMEVTQGSPASRAGTYVDPLIPAARRDVVLGADARLLAWVDVEVPVTAHPGTYVGSVAIRRATREGRPTGGDDGVLARIPVRVRVHRTALPDVPTLASHIGFDQSQLVRFEEVEVGTIGLRNVTDAYARELADARLSIADLGALPAGTLPGHTGRPGDEDLLLRAFGRRGVASVRIPFYMDYPFDDPIGRDRPAAVRYLRAAAAWARRNGWGGRAYVFAIDEPDDSRAGEVRELHELVREADPRLRLLVTREASARLFQGSVDIWSPNISPTRFRPADVAREHRRGNETWWYPSITTWQPYPTLFIDELRPAPRALGWLAWRYDVDGLLYWSATHWHEVDDPFSDPGTYNEPDVVGNGDGVLLYPGGPIGLPGTPIPSVRLFQLRDGIEDHDLLELADCAATPAQQALLERQARVVAPAMDTFSPTAAQVAALRASALRIADSARTGAGCRTAPR